MKPSWKDAPEWALYLAMDSDGEWYWYDVEPTKGFTVQGENTSMYIDKAEPSEHWDQTLEKRPARLLHIVK